MAAIRAPSLSGFRALGISLFTLTAIIMDAMAFDYGLSGTDWPPAYCLTGIKQSPIDISKPHIVYKGTTTVFRFAYKLWANYTISNTGHTIEVVPQANTANLVRLFEGVFVLKQFHVHVPSEHTIGGLLSAMEIHFVHERFRNTSDIAVVSVLFRYNPNDVPNTWLDSFIGEVPTTVSSHGVPSPLNPSALFLGGAVGTNKIGFYNYTGSLTTPKCNEGVHWYVLQTPQYLSVKQAIVFMNAISVVSGGERTNNRPPQPLNGRKIDAWNAVQ